MAENKRIRVSTDTTALQELRQQGEAVLNTFNQLEERFKGLATESLDLLHQQIDLIKERNDLLNGANLGIQPPRGEDGYQKQEDPHKAPIRGTGRTDDILRKILERTTSIDSKLKDPSATPGGGADQNKNQDDLGGGGGNILNSKLGRQIFSMASMAAIMGVVKRVMGVVRMGAEYEVGQATADNSYERRFAHLESGLMNTLTFGLSGVLAKQERKMMSRVDENLETSRAYSQLYGMSYSEAVAAQLRGYFGEGIPDNYNEFLKSISKRAYESGYADRHVDFDANDLSAGQVYSLSAPRRGPSIAGAPLLGMVAHYASKKIDENRGESHSSSWIQQGIDKANFSANGGQEAHSDISQTLGLSLNEYYKKIAELARAGVRQSNTSEADLYQMLVGQTIRGYSNEMMRQVLSVTRFGAEGTMTGTGVIQAMDTNLRKQGYDDQYIASTLDEYVSSFSRFAENMLGKVGRIETDNMIQSMTSIQNATGTEGRQLERIQDALTGQNVSKDDVTQALLLRTARQMNPNLSMFDLEATIENMPNDINLQRQFLKTIQDMTGGGDMMKYTLQAIFPNLSKNDILAITEGRKDLTEIFDHGSVERNLYNPVVAGEKLDQKTVSEAGTENLQLLKGFEQFFGQNGQKIDDIVSAIKQPRKVDLDEEATTSIALGVKKGVEDANIHIVE